MPRSVLVKPPDPISAAAIDAVYPELAGVPSPTWKGRVGVAQGDRVADNVIAVDRELHAR